MSSPRQRSWLHSDRFLARSVARPVQRFLHIEAAGGALLVLAAAIALVWANSPWSASYEALWSTELTIDLGGHVLHHDLRHWVNDGLMALFFFVIGLEIKSELVDGQLQSVRDAIVPLGGALGGMVVPALVYLSINPSGPGSAGWGIPMATDVAFALGVLALLGSRVPSELKVLLLGLAVIDDIGAILVIALFYSEDVYVVPLVAALAGLGLVRLLRAARVRAVPVYAVVGFLVWLAMFESGVHATLAGVALGLLAPARPFVPEEDSIDIADELSQDPHVTPDEVREISWRLRESLPVTERLQNLLHPWTSYVIVPVFALANTGVVLSVDVLRATATSRITIGILLGLVVGKFVGVVGGMLLATRVAGGRLPGAISSRDVLVMGAVAGVGFTVSLFIAGLAFADPELNDQARIGVLIASVTAAILAAALASVRRDVGDEGPTP